jgi:(p)ppGpp synthase/HD superfamily hydrolase
VALFQTQDKKEMQQAMITLKDEKTYLLTFSNTQSLQSWNKDARPLPLKALDIVKSIKLLEIDGFIIDINEDYRFKVESSLFDDIDNDVNKTYLNENFRDEIQKMIENYPEIDSIDIQHSNVCSARIVFYSKQDIADLVIEISKKLQENEQIQSLAPRGLDLLVGKK